MFKKYDFIIADCCIHLYTDVSSVIKKIDTEPRTVLKTIPCNITKCGHFDQIVEDKNCVFILSGNEKMMDVDKEKNNATLISPVGEFRFPDFVYVLLGLFVNLLKDEKKYLLHSATVVDDNNRSIMLVGDPGSGKSTLAYHLIRNYNYKLISNDTTVLSMQDDKLRTITGTKQMQLRLGAVKLYFPDLLPSLEKEDSTKNEWDCKPYINNILEAANVEFADESIVKSIFHITTAKDTELAIREEEEVDKRLYIYEQLIRQIRSTRNLIVGYNYPLPSFETEAVNLDIAALSKKIVDTTAIYDIRGSINEVAKEMVKRHEK